jgi:hypothetical protein
MSTQLISRPSESSQTTQVKAPPGVFKHPRTGFTLPDVSFFLPEGSHFIDNGVSIRPGGLPRGVLYFLGTGGGDAPWINPADTLAVCRDIQACISKQMNEMAEVRKEVLDAQDRLWRIREEEDRTQRDLDGMERRMDEARRRWVCMHVCMHVCTCMYTAGFRWHGEAHG